MLNAYAQNPAQTAPPHANALVSFMPIILIFIIFYFLLIRPQKKQQDDHRKMISGLNKNDEVITSGGIHGTIVSVKDDAVTLRIDDNVKIELQKNCVSVIKKKRVE